MSPFFLQMARWRRVLLLSFLAALLISPFFLVDKLGLIYGAPGTLDFVQYWSAFRLFVTGANPYDADLMLELQRQVGFVAQKPIMMWNPPWLLLILAPVLWLSFEYAALLWLVCNIFFLFGVTILIRKTFLPKCPIVPLALATAFFPPCWEAISWGQTSILLTFAVSAFLYCANQKRDFLGGIFLALLSLKPHLFIVLVPAVAFWVFYSKRWAVLGGFISSLLILVGSTAVLSDSFGHWISSFLAVSNDKADLVAQWYSASLADAGRYLIMAVAGWQFLWLRASLTLLGVISVFLYCLKPARCHSITRTLPPFLALSLLLAPYGWYYDQSTLLLIPLVIICFAFSRSIHASGKRRQILLVLAVVYMVIISFTVTIGHSQHHFFWVPFLFFLLWLWAMRNLEEGVVV